MEKYLFISKLDLWCNVENVKQLSFVIKKMTDFMLT